MALVWLLLLCCAPATALGEAGKASGETLWIPLVKDLTTGEQDFTMPLSDGTHLQLGDPATAKWAKRMIPRVNQLSQIDLRAWLTVVAYYRIGEAKGPLMKAAERLIKKPREIGDLHHQVFWSLAITADERSTKKLKRLLDSPIKPGGVITSGGNRDLGYRPIFAASLIKLDHEDGRDYFIASYKQDLLDRKARRFTGHITGATVETFYDSKLIEQVEALAEDPQLQEKRLQRNIQSRVELMRINGKPIEELRSMILDTEKPGEAYIQAVRALAERGVLEDIARLENSAKQPGLNHRLVEEIDHAVVVIRCRLWEELAKK
ncbi:MAG: hypothetical protein AAF085_05490 [Planctomycetota bacterium]